MVRLFDTECGSLKALNMVRILKHTKSLANICMSGVSKVLVEEAFVAINHDPGLLHHSIQGYSL